MESKMEEQKNTRPTFLLNPPNPKTFIMTLSVNDPLPIIKAYGLQSVVIQDSTTGTWIITIKARMESIEDLCESENVYGLECEGKRWKDLHPPIIVP